MFMAISTEIAKLDVKLTNLQKDVTTILCQKHGNGNNNIGLDFNYKFPIQTIEELNKFENEIIEEDFYKKIVS